MYNPEPNPEHLDKPFLNSVNCLRTTTGLSQEAFARLCGIKYSTMKRYDRGEQPLTYNDKEKIERATFEKVELYYKPAFDKNLFLDREDYTKDISEKFFKTFSIKKRWFDSAHNFPELSLGHYNSYHVMLKSLSLSNGWSIQTTKDIISKECYLAYPKITDDKLFELILILSQDNLIVSKINNKQELVNLVLHNCIARKTELKDQIQKMFSLPNLTEEEQTINLMKG